jgi:cytochrome c oxidase subunit III
MSMARQITGAGSLTDDIIKGPPAPPIDRGWGGGEGGNYDGRGADRRASFTGLFVLLAATTMVFAALTSAFVVRRGLSDDWASMHKPPILWVNTVVLLASSIVLDRARHALKARDRGKFNFWWTTATVLGVLFLAGQALAWYELKNAGVFIATNPSSSFFYVLTAAHAFHLLGGVSALIYVDVQALRLRLGPAKRTAIDVSAVFWHFLDGLWLYLMLLFYVWG